MPSLIFSGNKFQSLVAPIAKASSALVTNLDLRTAFICFKFQLGVYDLTYLGARPYWALKVN